MLEHFSEVFELQIEFVEMELARFMQNNNHDPSQVALVINAAPAAVKKSMKLKNKKIKAKQLSSTLRNKLGSSPAFKSVYGKVPNYFNEKRLYSLSQTATYSWKQHHVGDRQRMSYSRILLWCHFKTFIPHLYASECEYTRVTSAVVMQCSELMHQKSFRKISICYLKSEVGSFLPWVSLHFTVFLPSEVIHPPQPSPSIA